MIGLGVGIDYALFLVTKHRDQLAHGVERHDSIARAVATSGGAIVFAGGTVIIALLSLWVAGIPLVASLGYASAVPCSPPCSPPSPCCRRCCRWPAGTCSA
jgi:RND superfamily putative drug exporter